MELRGGLAETHTAKADLGNLDAGPSQWGVAHVSYTEALLPLMFGRSAYPVSIGRTNTSHEWFDMQSTHGTIYHTHIGHSFSPGVE
jgi:hypothetical protein